MSALRLRRCRRPSPTIISNAASGVPGPVSPGKSSRSSAPISGPPAGVPTVISGGSVQTLISETQVTFDNIPAPLLFVSATQINTIVPVRSRGQGFHAAGHRLQEHASVAVTLNVADAAPGIFMLNASGQGAILNEDGTVNGLENPAPRAV